MNHVIEIDSFFLQFAHTCNSVFGNNILGNVNSFSYLTLCLVLLVAVLSTLAIQPPLKNRKEVFNRFAKKFPFCEPESNENCIEE